MKPSHIYTEIENAQDVLRNIVVKTPLERSKRLSEKYHARIYLKREDLQIVRSYKIRGAYNKILSLSPAQRKKGVVCASAGNHAQGVAFSCSQLKCKGSIYMPKNTPRQKINRVIFFGGKWVDVVLVGDTFDEASAIANDYARVHHKAIIPPFNDEKVIAGQGTVGLEILADLNEEVPDYIVVPIGGGGLASGVSIAIKEKYPHAAIIGVEPTGAPAMTESLKKKRRVVLETIDKFVDGAAVKSVGDLTFHICSQNIKKMILVPEGKVCMEMIELYQNDGILTEPAGALSIAALDSIKDGIRGKTVVCVVSGSNNDISRYSEILERSLIYQGLKHYFLINFPQRPGALRSYLDDVLKNGTDITLFEYIKKSNRETGPALVGLELTKKEDLKPLLKRMDDLGFTYEVISPESPLFRFVQ